MTTPGTESFGELKSSFSYGTRSDLLFKFVRSMPDAEAAEFFRVLLRRVGQATDDGDLAPLVEHVYSSQVQAYSFVGATSQLRLRKEALPRWTARLQDAGVEAALLVPL